MEEAMRPIRSNTFFFSQPLHSHMCISGKKNNPGWIMWFIHRHLYNTPIERNMCQNCHIQQSVITGNAWELKLVQLWCSKPTDLLHIWSRSEEHRHVHYHLLLTTESTKKLMRRRAVKLPNPLLLSLSSLHLSNFSDGQTATQTHAL